MLGQILENLRSRGAVSIAFSASHPDSIIYNNGEKTLKWTINEEIVTNFKTLILEYNIATLTLRGKFEYVDLGDEPDIVGALYTKAKLLELIETNHLKPEKAESDRVDNTSPPEQPQLQQQVQQPNQPAEQSQQYSQEQLNEPPLQGSQTSTLQRPPNQAVFQQAEQPQPRAESVATQPDNNSQLQSAPIQQPLPEGASNEDMANYLIANIDRYLSTSSENVTVAIDHLCNIIDGGKVIDRPELDYRHMEALHKAYRKVGTNNKPITLSIGSNKYDLHLKTIGTHNVAEFHLVVDYEDYSLPATKEVERLISVTDTGGILFASSHRILKLEPALKIIESVDQSALMNLVSIGYSLPKHTDLPVLESTEPQWGVIRDSHYRYVFIDSKATVNMIEILSLIQNGKIVVLGVDASSAYSVLTKVESLLENSQTLKNAVFNTTIGILHAQLRRDTSNNSTLSLADTQFYLMSFIRAQEIIDGQLSVDIFNSRLENPAKVYNLSNEKASFSQEKEWQELLNTCVELKASDIFLAPGSKIKVRINGKVIALEDGSFITPQITKQLLFILSTQGQREFFSDVGHLDSNYSIPGTGRFRLHFVMQRGSIAIAVRPIQFGIPSATSMRIPAELVELVRGNVNGLVLTTGATGMGKSTTNAILIDNVMKSGNYVLVSLGDPVEYLHQHGNGIAIQREVPTDVSSFDVAINSIFRSNPDIAEIGELRDEVSIKSALRLGSSGHMTFSTLHTSSVVASIDAIINRCKGTAREEILESLAQNLLVVINQRLVQDVSGNRYPVFEYLVMDDSSRVLIAQDKLPQLEAHMKSMSESRQYQIARTMQDELTQLFEMNIIDHKEYNRVSKDILGIEGMIDDVHGTT